MEQIIILTIIFFIIFISYIAACIWMVGYSLQKAEEYRDEILNAWNGHGLVMRIIVKLFRSGKIR